MARNLLFKRVAQVLHDRGLQRRIFPPSYLGGDRCAHQAQGPRFGGKPSDEGFQRFAVARITSYNVCYTKLLRTRSSKARLKESLFNVLQFDIIDKIFIESFAGSGSIGLEALSRGAKRAYFVELDRGSYKILTKNCQLVEPQSCQTMLGDTFIQTPSILNSLKNSTDELVLYVDPPFNYREGRNNFV